MPAKLASPPDAALLRQSSPEPAVAGVQPRVPPDEATVTTAVESSDSALPEVSTCTLGCVANCVSDAPATGAKPEETASLAGADERVNVTVVVVVVTSSGAVTTTSTAFAPTVKMSEPEARPEVTAIPPTVTVAPGSATVGVIVAEVAK